MMAHPAKVNCRSGFSGVGEMYNLIETLCSTETSWSSANDENIDVTAREISVRFVPVGVDFAPVGCRE